MPPDGDQENVEPNKLSADELLDYIEVNTVLFVARYYINDPENFQAVLALYDFSISDLKAARTKLMEDYDAESVTYERSKTEPKIKNKLIEDLKRLLEYCTEADSKSKVYMPHPKDRKVVMTPPDSLALQHVRNQTLELSEQILKLQQNVSNTPTRAETSQPNISSTTLQVPPQPVAVRHAQTYQDRTGRGRSRTRSAISSQRSLSRSKKWRSKKWHK